ncbi:hypothetical protein [Novipirellula artificiosorum]|nr:hypothetical protein [Novipirellula artificiosorum]TWU35145.1 hypothetical protein Poly41_42890 [Novipirellula artificiosorum]
MFDNLYAAELNVAGVRDAARYGTEAQRILAETGAAVFGSYDRGAARIRSEVLLQELLPRAVELGNPKAIGDVWAGIVVSNALALRWRRANTSVATCLQHYRSQSDPLSFEISHTRWLDIWAQWNLGQWRPMMDGCNQMCEDALQRNDLFQWMVMSGAAGASAWLMRDQVEQCAKIREDNAKHVMPGVGIQMFNFTEWLANLHLTIYRGDFAKAWDQFESLRPGLMKLPFSRLQLTRVTVLSTGALICLHLLKTECDEQWAVRARGFLQQLKREQNAYADVLALLYGGLLRQLTSSTRTNKKEACRQLTLACQMAKSQQLRPYQLAAQDAIDTVVSGEAVGHLADRMHRHGVKMPVRFSRLYTVDLD